MSCSGEILNDDINNDLIQIKSSIIKQLRKAKYGVYGHATVGVCHWTKKSFRDEGDCYKNKFYGISTHRCMEFSPASMYCENRCVYCWRPIEFYDTIKMEREKVLEPKIIVLKLLEERKKLIIGHKGDPKQNQKKIQESMLPSHYAISLSGEPTMYPRLPELIIYLKSLCETRSIFLVTNGQEPDMLKKLQDENALPTQLYLSTNAADYKSFMRINRPRYRDSWERWNKSLEIISKVDTRVVIRVTLIRGYNDDMKMIPMFLSMLKKANPHFIEIKSYMHIGRSIHRLEKSHMLDMNEVYNFAKKIEENSEYMFSIMDESIISRIVVLQNTQRKIERTIQIPNIKNIK